MLSIGIICYQGHSSSAAIVKDGEVLLAISEERFSRLKHDDSFPINSILYILSELKLTINEIDEFSIAWSLRKTITGQFKKLNIFSVKFIFEKREGLNSRNRFTKFIQILNLKKEIRKRLNYSGKIRYVDHHLSHALSSYAHSGFTESIVFVADGMGESAATSIYHIQKDEIKLIYQDDFPHSLGIFYSAGTQFLNFVPDYDEFKVMGLAAYGGPSPYLDLMSKLYKFSENHLFLENTYFDITKRANQFCSKEYKALFGNCITTEDKANFAFALQATLEKIVLEIIKINKLSHISTNLCTSGGVFLNCLLNQKIRCQSLFKHYCFYPIADDNGTSIGAALLGQKSKFTLKKLDHLYLGPRICFNEKEIPTYLKHKKIESLSEVAKLLVDGNVIGWAQGHMEFGHRALGNRSILSDPRKKEMKALINSKVKYREDFRPFAPSVLDFKVSEYFKTTENENYNFMVETLDAFPSALALVPAVIHEDGTSRIQSVSRKSNEQFYNLIFEFYQLTNCPMLLNTSLNINGMPIVLSFKNAIECFINSELDYLVVEDVLIWK